MPRSALPALGGQADMSHGYAEFFVASLGAPATDDEAVNLAALAYAQAGITAGLNADGADNLERIASLAAELAGRVHALSVSASTPEEAARRF